MMRKYLFPSLVALSIAANAAFLAVWLVSRAEAAQESKAQSASGCEGGGIWCPLHKKLDVTPEQWKAIEPRIAGFRRESSLLCAEIRRRRDALMRRLFAPGTSRGELEAEQEALLEAQRRMQGLVMEVMLAEKDVLTERQCAALLDLLSRRQGCANSIGPARGSGGCSGEQPGGGCAGCE